MTSGSPTAATAAVACLDTVHKADKLSCSLPTPAMMQFGIRVLRTPGWALLKSERGWLHALMNWYVRQMAAPRTSNTPATNGMHLMKRFVCRLCVGSGIRRRLSSRVVLGLASDNEQQDQLSDWPLIVFLLLCSAAAAIGHIRNQQLMAFGLTMLIPEPDGHSWIFSGNDLLRKTGNQQLQSSKLNYNRRRPRGLADYPLSRESQSV